jgi:hypothetical protein
MLRLISFSADVAVLLATGAIVCVLYSELSGAEFAADSLELGLVELQANKQVDAIKIRLN